jgi:IMP dehydrogenase/GMP reductase
VQPAKETELDTIKTSLQNNQYKLTHIHTKTIKDLQEKHDNKKWAIFTYAGRE